LIRQGPCPPGYHVPSVEELYVLSMLYFYNQGITDNPILFTKIVGKQGGANLSLSAEQLHGYAQTFHFPFAGRIT